MAISFTQFVGNLNTLDVNLELKKSVEMTKMQTVDLNDKALLEGKDSRGKNLRQYASDRYSRYKQEKNSLPPYGVPDLHESGDFTKKMYADAKKKSDGVFISIDSTDRKRDWLVKGTSRMRAFGKDIFGLSMEDQKKYADMGIREILSDFIKTAILKNG